MPSGTTGAQCCSARVLRHLHSQGALLLHEVDERAEVLRSVFRFRFNVGTVQDPVADRVAASRAVDTMWENFFTDIVVPTLRESDLMKGVDLNVWFDGTGFRDFEVMTAVLNDIPLAVGSAVFIFGYMLFHTRSVVLALVGPFLAMMAVPITFICCGVFFGTTTVNFANFLAVFLAIGFGADVMFVYYDSWVQSSEVAEKIPNRLAWTYRRAVKASLATTSTTALSFLCNMASVIRALRQFGFFMGLCVLVAWVNITFIYVPIIVIDHTWCRRLRLVRRPSDRRLKSSSRKYYLCAHGLYRCRVPVVVLTIAAVVACVVVSAMSLQTSTSFPDIFPSNHNQNEGVRILRDFDGITTALPIATEEPIREVDVCRETEFGDSTCVMHWCEATFVDYKPRWGGNGTCSCLRRLRTSCVPGQSADVTLRLVGMSTLTKEQLSTDVGDHELRN
ncbi:DISP3 [Symbiodinium natans]|uniref:DISP3 protein n=1 Tax=Symbiodinium natans TaxID=878477 RepID=A0A812Q5K3_9DINO|nr:DISP3 [Symbiodinium natans]